MTLSSLDCWWSLALDTKGEVCGGMHLARGPIHPGRIRSSVFSYYHIKYFFVTPDIDNVADFFSSCPWMFA